MFDMTALSDSELTYLQGESLGRVATVGSDGTPHVAPVGWGFNPEFDTIDVGGRHRRVPITERRAWLETVRVTSA
jgi:hypothetical protein